MTAVIKTLWTISNLYLSSFIIKDPDRNETQNSPEYNLLCTPRLDLDFHFRYRCRTLWLVWRSGKGVGHINKVKLRRARLVLGLVTSFGGSIIPAFRGHSAWPSLYRSVQWLLSMVSATAGKKRRVMRSSGPCHQDRWHCHTGLLYASLNGSNPRRLKGQKGWDPSRRTSQSMSK